ncbi:MAG: ATP-binding cassette domain-containing protein [Clostridiales bacterium]|nr:ATP-binding cassette domain-containing protein [Clostridiales bacterium]
MEAIIKTEGLTKVYGPKAAAHDVNITVNKGEIYGLVGKNGAGKTTVFRMLLGLVKPTFGKISLFGSESTSELLKARRKIGSIIETPTFDKKMTAYQNLKAYSICKGVGDHREILELLDLVKLSDTGKKKFGSFSLGMKQRLGIAAALLGTPDILILDEPINGLDPEGIYEMRNIFLSLAKDKGVTILISSHLISELSKIASAYGIISEGKLVKELRGEELEKINRPFVKITVDDRPKALQVIASKGLSNNFEPVDAQSILIHDSLKDIKEITRELAIESVITLNIEYVESHLEHYFISMIGGSHA